MAFLDDVTASRKHMRLVISTALLLRAIRHDVNLLLAGWNVGIVLEFHNSSAKDLIVIVLLVVSAIYWFDTPFGKTGERPSPRLFGLPA